ncbi:hypothetical protein A6F68_01608 [Tsuneonella dongtanensis]|uniref:DUF4440 domain-containing protein n=1 Tax=Tsuneonella dongtanensis TaxID=692370 RepID=A0A1B2ADF0_9SPHN|nr:DUF4440 domain-containing protein [Tsuneonella dongtanensis]ANY20121.1 hypothetical protein A6F68_01608 [Tsuneonella dongtanensis]
MTLEDLNYIAQITAALAVVASLLFLGIQTRQNTKVMRAKAAWDAQNSFVAINDQLSDGGPLSEIMYRNLTGTAPVTDYEKYLIHRFMRAFLQRLEAQFALYQHGILGEELWTLRRGYARSVMAIPLVREIWEADKSNSMLTRGFIAEVEGGPASPAPVFAGIDPVGKPDSEQERPDTADFDTFVAAYQQGLQGMVQGDNSAVMALQSRMPDVTLANPLGPPIVGLDRIVQESARVARFYAGGSVSFEEVVRYVAEDFAWLVWFERVEAKRADSGEIARRSLRVTTIVRREEGEWRIALRHADTIGAEPKPA